MMIRSAHRDPGRMALGSFGAIGPRARVAHPPDRRLDVHPRSHTEIIVPTASFVLRIRREGSEAAPSVVEHTGLA
jgi:hypothetical protein